MITSYPLDPVIRKVNSSYIPQSSSDVLIKVNSKNKEIIRGTTLFKNVDYYLVLNTKDPRNKAEGTVSPPPIKDFSTKESLSIEINYQISCAPDNEEKALIALLKVKGKHTHVGSALNEIIEALVGIHVNKKEKNFIQNFNKRVVELKTYIEEEIKEKIGLDIILKIIPDGLESLTSLPFDIQYFPVRMNDSNEQVDLKFKTELIVDKNSIIKALQHLNAPKIELENFIVTHVQSYLHNHITTHQFYFELDDTVANSLLKYLNDVLKEKGRRLSFIKLLSKDIIISRLDLSEINHKVSCQIQEYPEPVIINNRLQLEMENYGKYKNKNCPELHEWANSTLDKIIRANLFEKKYLDILLKFESSISRSIKREMEIDSKKLGFKIKHLISVPNLVELKLKDNFEININNEFATQDSRANVKLGIVITLRIEDFTKENVQKLLNRRVNLKKLIESNITTKAQEILHNLPPQEFYFNFKYNPGGQSVCDKLEENIRELLENDYDATVVQIIPKILETELTERYYSLAGKTTLFEIEVESLYGGTPVRFKGNFTVERMHSSGLSIFQAQEEISLKKIKWDIEESLKAKMKSLKPDTLAYNSNEEQFDLARTVNVVARKRILEDFGLDIYLSNFSRERTEKEKLIAKAESSKFEIEAGIIESNYRKRVELSSIEFDEKIRTLKFLLNEKQRFIEAGADDDEIMGNQVRINELKAELPNYDTDSLEKEVNRAKPKLPSISREQELKKLIQLEESSVKPDLLPEATSNDKNNINPSNITKEIGK